MILTIEEYKNLNPNDRTADSLLELRLKALESAVRAYTNNNFQSRNFRITCDIENNTLTVNSPLFKAGDTVQITNSKYNNGVYVLLEGNKVEDSLFNETGITVTKVIYPPDLKIGVVNLLKWDARNREKLGVSSETLSRHTVNYVNVDGNNALLGYPTALIGFLTPYMKARF